MIVTERLTTEVVADTSQARQELERFSGAGSSAFGWVGAAKAAMVGLAGTAAAAFVGKAVTSASDYSETVSKVGQVYGDQQGVVLDYAQNMADSFGLPKTAILDAAAGFGLLGNAAGLAQDASAGMSTQLASLAADASSFYNVPLEEALGAIQSGLIGEAEPMRKFGVLMNDAAVQAKALEMGVWDGNGAMTEAQKVQARSALIMAGMTTASGDLERTQGSFSNRLREVQGRILNYATDLGMKLLPAATSVLDTFLEFPAVLGRVKAFLEDNRTAITVTAGVLTAIFLPAMVRSGASAVIAGAQIVGAWVAAQAAAIGSAAAQWAALYRVVAGWVAAGLAAVRSGAQTVAIWAMYRADAIRSAAVSVAAHARVVAGWVASGAAAAAGAARTVAGWVLAGATAAAQGAVMAASMAATAARVVAGWVLMGAQAMLQAARMAAAWFIALGPIGWITAAVIGLVALIVANWDTVSRVTSQVWSAIVGWVTGAWENIVGWVTTAVNRVRQVIAQVFAVIVTLVTMYVNAWRTVIATVWNAIVAVVRGAIAGVQAAIQGLASIPSRVGSWFSQVRDGIARALDSAVDFVRGIPARILSGFGNLGDMLYNAGASIIDGLARGIRSAVGKATDAVSGVVGAVRDFLPFSPAKRGPFSGRGWSKFSGQSIPRDLARGMVQDTRLVARAALGMARAAAVSVPSGPAGLPSAATSQPAGAGRSQAALDALGYTAQNMNRGPSTLVIVDQDRNLIGRMQVEAGRVSTGAVTPLDHGRAAWA